MSFKKPIVTFAGDKSVFSNIEPGLVSGLSSEAVEWKRSYGRTSRQVYVECEFQQWPGAASSPTSGGAVTSLQGQPVFHTYWTDVYDLDLYRQGVKDDISTWVTSVRRASPMTDWMIILVETPEGKKGNKFPLRTTVLDKIKQDIGGKTPERCVSVTDPSRADSRAADSMQSLLHKFRLSFLQSYNKVLNKFEENIRSQRERRNDSNWNFCQYFLLQEELALVYQSLGLFDEALIQYDELDALFTQFVLNCSVDDCPAWLEKFKSDMTDWTPLTLNIDTNMKLREKLETSCTSLIDMRNYLFSRQCCQLFAVNKAGEVTARTVAFLHNTAQELEILEIKEAVDGSLDSWVLLACLEVVQTCERLGSEETTVTLTSNTASLWALAREKLLNLGKLCGLMPGQAPSSDQLHTVISLTGGLPDLDHDAQGVSPCQRLKESLSSNSSFQKNYLEMCEIAISSYKHIGRMRSAKLVGRDLASFYIEMDQYAKATTFLVESLKTYQHERWTMLSLQTMLDLAKCYSHLGDSERYARMCAQIASCEETNQEEKSKYFNEFIKSLDDLSVEDNIVMPSEEIFNFVSCSLDQQQTVVSPGDSLTLELTIVSNLPKPVKCDKIKIALSFGELKNEVEKKDSTPQRKPVTRSPSAASNHQVDISLDNDEGSCVELDDEDQLDMVEQLDYKQDKSLCSARLVCRNTNKVLTRKDSSGSMLRDLTQQQKADFTTCLETGEVVLEPGVNNIRMTATAGPDGNYNMTQMSVKMRTVEFLHDIEQQCPVVSVSSCAPSITLDKDARELFAGLENTLVVSVHTGSHSVMKGTKVYLQTLRGLQVKAKIDDSYGDRAAVELPDGDPFTEISTTVYVRSELNNRKDSSTIEHKIQITDPWTSTTKDVFLHFTPAFYTTFHLLTALDKKFLQIFVIPLGDNCFSLRHHQLTLSTDAQLSLTCINSPEEVLVADANCEAGYLWQLVIDKDASNEVLTKQIKASFSVEFTVKKDHDKYENYDASFSFQNFLTLYTIQGKIEPVKGSEFCRQNSMCPMTITLEQRNESPYNNLYYEVIADQSVWAVCGKQGAVLTLTQGKKQNIVVEVMPLIAGHLSLPSIRLSKYIPAEDGGSARLDPFSMGEVYNMSKSQQVHVLPASNNNQDYHSLH